jgi:integrase
MPEPGRIACSNWRRCSLPRLRLEVLGMRYGDLDLSEGVWRVSGQWAREGQYDESLKTKASLRRVPLSPSMVKALAARKLAKGAGDDSFVFASSAKGSPPSHNNFRRRGWNKAVANAKLTDGPKLTPHDARHAFASQMGDLGLSSSDVAEVLGHSTARVPPATSTDHKPSRRSTRRPRTGTRMATSRLLPPLRPRPATRTSWRWRKRGERSSGRR